MNMEKILTLPAFVIHIDKFSNIRKEFFSKNIKNAGYKDIRIFNGIDGTNAKACDDAIKKLGDIKIDSKIVTSSKGCLLSHFLLLKKIIDEKIEVCTIFEDDVYFHPEWNKLKDEYYSQTPNDWEIIFIGNQQINPETLISNKPCFCRHAYILKLEGAKKMFNTLINWDYKRFNKDNVFAKDGLINGDIMMKLSQLNNPSCFIWYCWNGRMYPCEGNTNKTKDELNRNCGLVFQNFSLKQIQD